MRTFTKYLSKFSGILFLLFLLGIWVLISCGPEWDSQYLFPSPKAIVKALFDSREELLRSAGASLLKLVPAYLVASIVGISIGIVSGSVPWVSNMLKPISRFAAPIPPNVYIPYAIAILPTFYLSSTFIIFIAAFWPIYLNTAAGAAEIPEKYRRNAAIIGIGKFEYLWRIALVASLTQTIPITLTWLPASFGQALWCLRLWNCLNLLNASSCSGQKRISHD